LLREGHQLTIAETSALEELCTMIKHNIPVAASVLGSRDVDGAQTLIAQKDAFRTLENDVINSQVGNKQNKKGANLRRSALFIDLVRDLHRLNTHVVSAGYPIVDAAGLLRQSRLRKEAKAKPEP
jgi:phosphate:Na+ symporter